MLTVIFHSFSCLTVDGTRGILWFWYHTLSIIFYRYLVRLWFLSWFYISSSSIWLSWRWRASPTFTNEFKNFCHFPCTRLWFFPVQAWSTLRLAIGSLMQTKFVHLILVDFRSFKCFRVMCLFWWSDGSWSHALSNRNLSAYTWALRHSFLAVYYFRFTMFFIFLDLNYVELCLLSCFWSRISLRLQLAI